MAAIPDALTHELHPPLGGAEAIVEADRCLECGRRYAQAPCTVACPADIDVPGFVGAIARDEADEAARIIFSENLLGATCGRVCPVEALCEGACVLDHEGRRPVSVGALQRFATDRALAHDVHPRTPLPPTGRRVAVIGAGPAGLVCAGELAARGHDVSVYDEHGEPGGLVRYAIAPFREQRDPLPQEARMLSQLGVDIQLGRRIGSREELEGIAAHADAVVLAIGMGADVDVRLPGDELPGVWESLPFIEALKTGAPPAVGGSVAVIGGGNTAIDVARESLRLGAHTVTIVYRRTANEMPAYPHEVAEAREEGVRFQWLSAPVAFHGHDRLESLECRYMRLGDPDASGRRRPEPVPGTEFRIAADTAVKAIGQRPRAELLGWIDGVELDGAHVSVESDSFRTGNSKYFSAGDAVTGGATVVEAVREAKAAARAIDEELRGVPR